MAKPTLSKFELTVTPTRIISFQRIDFPIQRQGKTIPFEVTVNGSTTYIQKKEIDSIIVQSVKLPGPRDNQENAYTATVVTDYQDNTRAMQVLMSGVINHVKNLAENSAKEYKISIEKLTEISLEEMSRNSK